MSKNQSKIRLSYSLISLAKRGQYDEAIKLYLHLEDREPTEAMERGTAFDRMAKEIALREHRLPDELGGIKLESNDITAGEKIIVEYGNYFLSAELDIRNGKDIIELKCSEVADSADWMTTGQVQFYLFIAKMAGTPMDRALIYRYDPAKREYDVSIAYPNERIFEEVQSDITIYGQQLLKAFTDKGVI